MKKGFYLKIYRERGDLESRSFFITSKIFKIFISIFILLFFWLIFATYIFIKKENQKRILNNLTKENKSLKEKINEMEKNLNELKNKILFLIEEQNKLRNYVNFEPISPEIVEMPVGGIPLKENKINSLEEKIDYFLNLTKTWEKEIRDLKYFLEKNENLRRTTPSISPVKGGFITAKFGLREDPFTGIFKFHKGIDIASSRGTPVFATADGIVKYTGWKEGLGLTVEIDHGNGFVTLYAHLDRILVKQFQRVRRGEVIGTMGATGLATGVHLHYEVKLLDKNLNPINYIIPDEEYFD
jgi:murein DD-endopeptidase MepM/ murein hydrolase activator NlpD